MSLKRKSNRWYWRFRVQGQQYEGSTGLPATRQHENAAKSMEAEARLRIERGLMRSKQRDLSFSMGATEFLTWCHSTRYRQHPNSAKRISGSFSSLLEYFGERSVRELSAIDIERYKTYRAEVSKVKDVTLRNDLNALSLFLSYAVRAGWKDLNPLKGESKVERPSGEDAVRMYIVSAEEEQIYFAACGRRKLIADIAKLILLQGCRPDEIMSLEKISYDRRNGQIRILRGKTKAAKRTLTLTNEATEIIERRWRQADRWLFPSPKKAGDHVRQIDHTHTSVLQDSDPPLPWFVLYDFRHTFATRMVQDAKIDLPTLAAILGHSSLRMVLKYVHPTAEHQRKAMKLYDSTRSMDSLRLQSQQS